MLLGGDRTAVSWPWVLGGSRVCCATRQESQLSGPALKRFLLMFSDRIFISSVDRAIPSLAAAPDGPTTRPWLSRRASSIISFSLAASFSDRYSLPPGCTSPGCCDNQLSSTENFSVSLTITDRSMTFCNSRMLPGQG